MARYFQMLDLSWFAHVAAALGLLGLALYAKNRDADDAERIMNDPRWSRLVGLIAFGFGLVYSQIMAFRPLAELARGERMVMIHGGAAALPVLLMLGGIGLIVFGGRLGRHLVYRPGQPPSRPRVAILAAGLVFVLLAELATYRYFESRGYRRFPG